MHPCSRLSQHVCGAEVEVRGSIDGPAVRNRYTRLGRGTTLAFPHVIFPEAQDGSDMSGRIDIGPLHIPGSYVLPHLGVRCVSECVQGHQSPTRPCCPTHVPAFGKSVGPSASSQCSGCCGAFTTFVSDSSLHKCLLGDIIRDPSSGYLVNCNLSI